MLDRRLFLSPPLTTMTLQLPVFGRSLLKATRSLHHQPPSTLPRRTTSTLHLCMAQDQTDVSPEVSIKCHHHTQHFLLSMSGYTSSWSAAAPHLKLLHLDSLLSATLRICMMCAILMSSNSCLTTRAIIYGVKCRGCPQDPGKASLLSQYQQ